MGRSITDCSEDEGLTVRLSVPHIARLYKGMLVLSKKCAKPLTQ